MAARYVNPANVVAQGQSFYTGLQPGSFEQSGGARTGNVMGAGSGGSAGVSADRTASEATSISDYKPGTGHLGTLLTAGDKAKPTEVTIAGQGGGVGGNTTGGNLPGGPGPGGQPPQGQNPAGGTPAGGPNDDLLTPDAPPAQRPTGPVSDPYRKPKGAGGTTKAMGTAVGAGVGTYVTGQTGNPALGRAAGVASGAIATHGFEKMGEKLSESPAGRAVQGRASTRSHTRQPGVQQSATQQSIPFPNMPNSTNRSLTF